MSNLYLDPILAWRAWKVADGRLYSTVFGTLWPERTKLEATCGVGGRSSFGGLRGVHDAPYGACDCGIYGLKTEADALAIARHVLAPAQVAVGRVSLWGRVIETSLGYRAQYAYVYDVYLQDGTPEELVAIRERYAVDAQLADAA